MYLPPVSVAQPGTNMARPNKLKSWNSKIEELVFKLQRVRNTTGFQIKSLLHPLWIISINTGTTYLYCSIILPLAGEYTSEVQLFNVCTQHVSQRYGSLTAFSSDAESACSDFLDWKWHDTAHQPGLQAIFQEEIHLKCKSFRCTSSEAGNYYFEGPWYYLYS